MSYIRQLRALRATDLATAGGKGANLGEAIYAGLPVPPGFCITTAAYRDFVEAHGLGDAIRRIVRETKADDTEALERAYGSIRSLFLRGTMAASMAGEIREAYAEFGGPVAVRSSATARIYRTSPSPANRTRT